MMSQEQDSIDPQRVFIALQQQIAELSLRNAMLQALLEQKEAPDSE